jgi:uncharacterized protein (TIRG00374 family)
MKRSAKTVLGIVVSVLLLWWAMRDVSLAEVSREMKGADPLLFGLAVAATTFQFVIRAARWRVLLLPIAPAVAFRPRFAATNIGFAVNNLLPARVGEFARAYSLSRLTGVPVSSVFATLVVERVLDGLVLVGFLFAAMASPAFPSFTEVGGVDVRTAAAAIAGVMGLVGVALFFMVVAPERSTSAFEAVAARLLPASLLTPVLAALRSFLKGLAVLRSGRLFLASLAWAIGQWGFLVFSFLLAFRAFGITEVGVVGAVFLQSLIALAVAVPSSPGFFGPYEAATKLGLSLWGVSADKAVSMAIGFHLGGFVPVTLMGVYYLWRMGLSWRDMERSEEVVEDVVERESTRPDAEIPESARHG